MPDFTKYDEVSLLAGLAYGEARLVEDNQMDELREYFAIWGVVLNRAITPRWPATLRDVILQPAQFSSFNRNDPNAKVVDRFLQSKQDKTQLKRLMFYAKQFTKDRIADFSGGANHYVAKWFYEKADCEHWSRGMKITSLWGGHIFLKGEIT